MTEAEFRGFVYNEIEKAVSAASKSSDWDTTKESIVPNIIDAIVAGAAKGDAEGDQVLRNKINEIITVLNFLLNQFVPMVIPTGDDKYWILAEYLRELKQQLAQYSSTFPNIQLL